MLTEMRIQDLEDDKKLQRAEYERIKSMRTEDVTESEESEDSDEGEEMRDAGEEMRDVGEDTNSPMREGENPSLQSSPLTLLEQVRLYSLKKFARYVR